MRNRLQNINTIRKIIDKIIFGILFCERERELLRQVIKLTKLNIITKRYLTVCFGLSSYM